MAPAKGIAREHLRGFQLDLTATNGNSGGPVVFLATGHVCGALQRGAIHPQTGHVVQGLAKAEPVYPLFYRTYSISSCDVTQLPALDAALHPKEL